MNIKRHQQAIDIINIMMRFIPAYLFIAIITHFFDPQSSVHTLFLLPIPILSYLIKKYTQHIWSFLVFHGVLLALYLVFLTNVALVVAASFYIAVLAIIAYYNKNQRLELENTSPVLLILFVMLYTACYLTKMSELQQLCFLLSIVYVLLFITNKYLLNLVRFVYNHEGMTNIPFHQIRASNRVMTTFLGGLFLIMMLTFSLIPLDRLFSVLGKLFIRLIRFLISLFRFEEPEDSPEPEEEDMLIEDYPINEPSRLMEIISQILEWVAAILVIVFILAAVMYALYQIYQYFYLKSDQVVRDKIEFLSPFVQKERVKHNHKKIFRNLFGRSNNAQIRKFFIQAVNANLTSDTKLDQSLTPSEISASILGSPSETSVSVIEQNHLITEYYEKARYSNEECSKEEVHLIKKLLKDK